MDNDAPILARGPLNCLLGVYDMICVPRCNLNKYAVLTPSIVCGSRCVCMHIYHDDSFPASSTQLYRCSPAYYIDDHACGPEVSALVSSAAIGLALPGIVVAVVARSCRLQERNYVTAIDPFDKCLQI